jgi:hypothetical protein
MTTLHDRLSDLADEAPISAAPPGTWSAGRRLQRRQRLGTGLVVATVVALLSGLVGFSWAQSDVDVQPASPTQELGLPDRFYPVSERLPGTDDTGPIGPLSATLTGYERLVGISGTGEYAYLDLPAWPTFDSVDFPAEAALSADGTQLAYWSTGRPSGEPVSDVGDPVVAVRVYDTVTGDTVMYAVPTEHGLSPEDLVWAGDRLWFEVWQYDGPEVDGGRSSTRQQTVAWVPSTDEHRVWEATQPVVDLTGATGWNDSLVTSGGEGAVRLTTVAGTELRARLSSPPVRGSSSVFLDEEGEQVAVLGDRDEDASTSDGSEPLLVADLPDELGGTSSVPVREVPGTREQPVFEVLGWRDATHVVVSGFDGDLQGALSVDVETGEQVVLAARDSGQVNRLDFAADALTGPVFDAPEPPEPLHPLLVYGGIGAILVAGAGALVWWRRRVQR